MSLFTTLIDLLYPPRKEQLRIRNLSAGTMLSHYCRQTLAEDLIALSSFADVDIQACVHEMKYFNSKKGAKLTAVLLKTYLEEMKYTHATLLPIPLSAKRHKQRGHNQSHWIAVETQKLIPTVRVRTDVLKRKIHTKPQTKLARKERLQNVSGAFCVTDTRKLSENTVLIIDDVTTTGATLQAAKAALLPLATNTRIICIAIAH